ncbi:MAG: molybdopterin-binding protein [Kiloniellales bacterium]|nr:molybdopterin-binding protein [Kiloniellales bacterium]MDJ0982361.1 molybdopterin-binding protein [Kiloniellales bacterium]
MTDGPVTAAVLIIGNEILSGRTKDANLPYLGERLGELGIRLAEARVVADLKDEIVAAVNVLRQRYTYVFTTGGIGPTHDDITAECVAAAFGRPLIRNPEALALLQAHYAPGDLNEARLRMANTPEGATLIENPISHAPGFRMENVHVLAGVPAIMRAMFDSLAPGLTGGPPLRSRTVTSKLPEGALAAGLGALQVRYPEVDIGSYPSFRDGRPSVAVVLRATDESRLAAAADEVGDLIRGLGAEPREAG